MKPILLFIGTFVVIAVGLGILRGNAAKPRLQVSDLPLESITLVEAMFLRQHASHLLVLPSGLAAVQAECSIAAAAGEEEVARASQGIRNLVVLDIAEDSQGAVALANALRKRGFEFPKILKCSKIEAESLCRLLPTK